MATVRTPSARVTPRRIDAGCVHIPALGSRRRHLRGGARAPRAPPAGSPRPCRRHIFFVRVPAPCVVVGCRDGARARADAGAFARLGALDASPRAHARPASPSATRASTPSPNPPCHAATGCSSERMSTRRRWSGSATRQADELEHLRPRATPSSPPAAAAPNPPPSTPIRASRAPPPPRVPSLASSPTSRSRTPTSSSASSPPARKPSSSPSPRTRCTSRTPAPLCSTLRHVENFYDMLGGVVGYQFAAVELVHEAFGATPPRDRRWTRSSDASADADRTRPPSAMHVPVGPDLREGASTRGRLRRGARRNCGWRRRALGGAGDRLGLQDEVTGESLLRRFSTTTGVRSSRACFAISPRASGCTTR